MQGVSLHPLNMSDRRASVSRATSPGPAPARSARRGGYETVSAALSPETMDDVDAARVYYGDERGAPAGPAPAPRPAAAARPLAPEDGGETSEYYGTDGAGAMPRAVGALALQ